MIKALFSDEVARYNVLPLVKPWTEATNTLRLSMTRVRRASPTAPCPT
jgi:hypothetical protein